MKIAWLCLLALIIAISAFLGLSGMVSIEKYTPTIVQKADEPITLLFVGDMMFDRGVAKHAETFGMTSLFQNVKPLLAANDAVIGNLEGTITSKPSIAQVHNSILHFTFDQTFASLLKDAGFTAVSQANNHALDFYQKGFDETQKNLDDNGVLHFGSPNNLEEGLSSIFFVKGKSICMVGYHDLYTYDPTPALAEIQRIKHECDLVVLFAHWGVEYELKQTARQVDLGHEFIDAGADLVIGAHPHVVEPVEIYKGKAIFYSLGNFVFDQGLSFWTEHGLAVKVALSNGGGMKFDLIPTALNHTEASVASSTDAAKIFGALGSTSPEFSL